jgi:hypothetical protein
MGPGVKIAEIAYDKYVASTASYLTRGKAPTVSRAQALAALELNGNGIQD